MARRQSEGIKSRCGHAFKQTEVKRFQRFDQFLEIRHSRLVKIVDAHAWNKKTYNNVIGAPHRAFEIVATETTSSGAIRPARSAAHTSVRKTVRQLILSAFRMRRHSSPHFTATGARPKATTISYGSSPGCAPRKRSRCESGTSSADRIYR